MYAGFAKNFAKTKVEREAAQPMDLVWSRLQSLDVDRNVEETNLLLVHNKLPVKERLFRIYFSDAAVFQDSKTNISSLITADSKFEN